MRFILERPPERMLALFCSCCHWNAVFIFHSTLMRSSVLKYTQISQMLRFSKMKIRDMAWMLKHHWLSSRFPNSRPSTAPYAATDAAHLQENLFEWLQRGGGGGAAKNSTSQALHMEWTIHPCWIVVFTISLKGYAIMKNLLQCFSDRCARWPHSCVKPFMSFYYFYKG